MDFEIIEDLEEKFDYLEKHKKDTQRFELVLGDYIKYLGESKPLGRVVRKLALNDEIPVSVLKSIFGSFMVPQLVHLFKEISYPPFWDNTVEEKFHLQSDFQKFFLNLNERIYKEGSYSNIEMQWVAETYPVLNFKAIANLHNKILEGINRQGGSVVTKEGNYLKSIHLVVETLNPTRCIFVVLDGQFEHPTRFAVLNRNKGNASIKNLFNIAYIASVSGKRVEYSENLADSINNGLFKRREIEKYMKTNHIKKPTLVQKDASENILVLKNDVPVRIQLIKHIPSQHQSLYIDKTI